MRIGKFHIEDVTGEFQEPDIDTIFEISVQHKYWYLWFISIIFGSWSKYIQIIRTDWNKCYKSKCLNYTEACKHNLECNECKECFKKRLLNVGCKRFRWNFKSILL